MAVGRENNNYICGSVARVETTVQQVSQNYTGHLLHCMARSDVTQVTHSACFMNYTSREALSLTQASLSTDSVRVHYTQYSEDSIERFSIAQNDTNFWYSDMQSRITVNYYRFYDTPVVYRWFWQENV